jgi:tRNA pseudouridine38-40 synthase
MRYKLTIEYDGTSFYGFQIQDALPTIQGEIEKALCKLTFNPVRVYGAGRTDQGVHARGQVAHIDLDKEWDPHKLKFGLNHYLRKTMVCILNVEPVSDDFHARFGAKYKQYMYRIINRQACLTLDKNRAWHVPVDLNLSLMHEGAQIFVGQHDFSSFRDSDCQAKSPFRTIDKAKVEKEGEEIRIIFEGKSFLHHQVRNMVGTLKLLGQGRFSLSDVENILKAKDRKKAGPTAPSEGLYLMWIDYHERHV